MIAGLIWLKLTGELDTRPQQAPPPPSPMAPTHAPRFPPPVVVVPPAAPGTRS